MSRGTMSEVCKDISHVPQPQSGQEAPVTVLFQCLDSTHTCSHTHPAFSKPAGNHKKLSTSLGTAKDASVYLMGSLLFLFHFLPSP